MNSLRILPNSSRYADERDRGDLTNRELDIVRMMIGGSTERAAAYVLGISQNNVHFHLVSIYRKLRVSSRGMMIAAVLVDGIVSIEEAATLIRGTQTGSCESESDLQESNAWVR